MAVDTKATTRPSGDIEPPVGSLHSWGESWRIELEYERKSPKTIYSYLDSLSSLIAFLDDHGAPIMVTDLRRDHLRAYFMDMRDRLSLNTEGIRYRSLRRFFNFVVSEDEGVEGGLTESPMRKLRAPPLPQFVVPVIPEEDLKRLKKACSGKRFEQRRDRAIIQVLLGTGVRRAELGGMTVDDIDMKAHTLSVVGKGGRLRIIGMTRAVERYLARYLRARAVHKDSDLPWLWLGIRGRMTDSGVAQMIKRRCRDAGIDHIHPHQFRHTCAHLCKASGMSDGDLMTTFGWTSMAMPQRYGASNAVDRAVIAVRELNIGGDR
jgi:site-specific recombinase XerD